MVVIDLRFFGGGIYDANVSKDVPVESGGRSPTNHGVGVELLMLGSGVDLVKFRVWTLGLSEVVLLKVTFESIILGNNRVGI